MFIEKGFTGVVSLILIVMFWGGSPRPVSAAAFDDIGSGQILFKKQNGQYRSAMHLESHADFEISGIIARVTLTQTFRNDSDDWQEAVYVLPLPETAAVNEMVMRIGERIIRASIKEKAEAREIFEKAKSSGRKAALTEQSRPNLFRQNIANIAPGESIEIELKYLQSVRYDKGEFSLRFPMTLTPRFMPAGKDQGEQNNTAEQPAGESDLAETTVVKQSFEANSHGWAAPTPAVPDAHLISPPMRRAGAAGIINPISLNVALNPGLELEKISSAYHQVSVRRDGMVYKVGLVDGVVPMDRDYLLSWRPIVGGSPRAAAFRETVAGEDYVLVMMLPPEQGYEAITLPRDMIFVIDTSGSMQGTSIEQAKVSLRQAIADLRPEDRFNIVEFNTGWSRLFSSMQSVDPYHMRHASDWVSRLSAGGGTNMLPALDHALSVPTSEDYLKHIVFITDGAVGNETQLFELLASKLGDGRMFTVGIGSAPNSYFMRQSAKFGKGTYTHIGDLAEVGEKMNDLFRKIDSPVASQIGIQWPATVESYPARIPAIYQGEPLLVVAKAPSLQGDIVVNGQTARLPWQQTLSLASKNDRSGVATLWARKKIESLEDEGLRGRDEAEVRADILEVALNHSLITRFTSLVAVEDIVSRHAEERLKTTPIANAVPHGQVMYPRTATSATQSFVLGLLTLLVAVILDRWRRIPGRSPVTH